MSTTAAYDEKEKYDSSSEDHESGASTPLSSPSDLADASKLEAQVGAALSAQQLPLEHRTSSAQKAIFLAAWFFLNLALTISNKAVLGRAHFPWLLTTLHASATSLGCFALMGLGKLKIRRLTVRESVVLTAFSFLFTLNIAISNVSLDAVSVPFHQIFRSLCPIATILIYRWIYGRTYSTQTYLSMVPLILGVAIATVGDYYATLVGIVLTALGVVLAAAKTVATNRLITGAFSPMEVLLLMSPLAAAQCVCYAFMSGEVDHFRHALAEGAFSSTTFGVGLAANAFIAFALNVVSFQTNKVAGALTVTVCGNVKQALTILFGVVLFGVPVGGLNALGMMITIIGAAYYSSVELEKKRASSQSG